MASKNYFAAPHPPAHPQVPKVGKKGKVTDTLSLFIIDLSHCWKEKASKEEVDEGRKIGNISKAQFFIILVLRSLSFSPAPPTVNSWKLRFLGHWTSPKRFVCGLNLFCFPYSELQQISPEISDICRNALTPMKTYDSFAPERLLLELLHLKWGVKCIWNTNSRKMHWNTNSRGCSWSWAKQIRQ